MLCTYGNIFIYILNVVILTQKNHTINRLEKYQLTAIFGERWNKNNDRIIKTNIRLLIEKTNKS